MLFGRVMGWGDMSTPRLGFVRTGNLAGAACMCLVVAFFGMVPVVITLGSAHNPFLFSAAMKLGCAVLCGVVLVVSYRRDVFRKGTWVFVARGLLSSV